MTTEPTEPTEPDEPLSDLPPDPDRLIDILGKAIEQARFERPVPVPMGDLRRAIAEMRRLKDLAGDAQIELGRVRFERGELLERLHELRQILGTRDVIAAVKALLAERDAALAAVKAGLRDGTCTKCDGCGQVADTEAQEPWSAWINLPTGSAAAMLLGVVKPKPCPRCSGSGKEPAHHGR